MKLLAPKLSLLKSTSRLTQAVKLRARELSEVEDLDLAMQHKALSFSASGNSNSHAIAHNALRSFPLTLEAIRRKQSIELHDVQIDAAWALCQRSVVQMATGEGKTLSALLPLATLATYGKGVFLLTANDYLVQRDASLAGDCLALLGLSVGAVFEHSTEEERRSAYRCDITYLTASQLGFDFLRDRARRRHNGTVPRHARRSLVGRGRLFAAVVDEVDSLLIDNATTPLALATGGGADDVDRQALYRWAAALATQATEGQHFTYRQFEGRSELTPIGKRWILNKADNQGRNSLSATSLIDRIEFVERAINVERDLLRDCDYLLSDQQIQLIDHETGRIGVGREWADGVQQAIQAKEGLPITKPNGQLARVTIQSLFHSFQHLSGMTGTAAPAKQEFREIYQLGMQSVPTHLPNQRVALPPQVASCQSEWLDLLWTDATRVTQEGRAVLIGSRDISQSEVIAEHFTQNGRSVQLLNAKQDAYEAGIVAEAGQTGQITVATNMAGRGTDIQLETKVRAMGGLHIIVASLHDSLRIDRQLIGRCARQGDPGSYRIILNIEDPLLDEAYSPGAASRVRQRLIGQSPTKCLRTFQRAQKRIEYRQRVLRDLLFRTEKMQLKAIDRTGMDPLLDCPV